MYSMRKLKKLKPLSRLSSETCSVNVVDQSFTLRELTQQAFSIYTHTIIKKIPLKPEEIKWPD